MNGVRPMPLISAVQRKLPDPGEVKSWWNDAGYRTVHSVKYTHGTSV